MFSLMGSTAVAYLAVTGLATNLALAGRGVVRTLRRAARGELADAGKEALDALSAPAVLTLSKTDPATSLADSGPC
jgi:hypothetical protein